MRWQPPLPGAAHAASARAMEARTKVKQLPDPKYPEPAVDTYSSVEKFTSYLARVWNSRAPEAEIHNARIVSPDGHVRLRHQPSYAFGGVNTQPASPFRSGTSFRRSAA